MESKNLFYNLYYDWWKNIDKFIFGLIVLLFFIGLFFSLVSTSLIVSDRLDTNDYSFFFKHLVFIILGIIIIFIFSSVDQNKIFKYSNIIFIISLVFLLLVPLIGIEVKGSRRWIDLYFLPRFQPIELVKPFLIIFISLILCNKKYENIILKYSFSFIITLCIALLLSLQPDIGQTLLVLLSWSILIFTSGISMFFLIFLFSFLIVVFFYLILFVSKFEYIKFRLLSFINSSEGGNLIKVNALRMFQRYLVPVHGL